MQADDQLTKTHPVPLAYLLTFHTYGTWMHGDEDGSVDPAHNQYGQPLLEPDPERMNQEQAKMAQSIYLLDKPRRDCVVRTIQEVCNYRGWTLLAAHVRSTHVHVVLHADQAPEKVMADLKAYSSRRLTEAGFDSRDRKRWAIHGSTRYLWDAQSADIAIQYVVEEQGEAMAVFKSSKLLSEYVSTDPRP